MSGWNYAADRGEAGQAGTHLPDEEPASVGYRFLTPPEDRAAAAESREVTDPAEGGDGERLAQRDLNLEQEEEGA